MGDEARWRDWAHNAWADIKKRRDEKRLKDQALAAENKLKLQKAPLLWEKIRADLKSMRDALNTEGEGQVLAWDSVKSDEAVIRIISTSSTTTVTFDPELLTITVQGLGTAAVYSAEVVHNEVFFVDGSTPRQPHEIAKRLMGAIVARIK